MKAITRSELASLLRGIRGATFATLVTKTDARLKKTGNPFGPVDKVSRVNVTLGFQYENSVNRQRVREESEPDFKAAPRQWGERIPGTVLVEHKGKLYLETKVERALGHRFMDSSGTEIPSAKVERFLPARRPSTRQETEKEILVRDYRLDSIQALVLNKEEIVILPD